MRWELVETERAGVSGIGGQKKKMPALPPENAGIIQRLFEATFLTFLSPSLHRSKVQFEKCCFETRVVVLYARMRPS
jgi:hypothetical protein